MGLFDGLRASINQRRQLADNTVDKPGSLDQEIGVAGESLISGYNSEESASDNISIAKYTKMRQNDGTVQALYNILTLPMLSTNWQIEADEEDADEKQAQLVRDNFELPPQQGGMLVPFQLVLAKSIPMK